MDVHIQLNCCQYYLILIVDWYSNPFQIYNKGAPNHTIIIFWRYFSQMTNYHILFLLKIINLLYIQKWSIFENTVQTQKAHVYKLDIIYF